MAEVTARNDGAATAEQTAEEGGAFNLAAASGTVRASDEAASVLVGCCIGDVAAGDHAEQDCGRGYDSQASGGLVRHFRALDFLLFSLR